MIHKNFKRKLLNVIPNDNWITIERLNYNDDFYYILEEILIRICEELVEEGFLIEDSVETLEWNVSENERVCVRLMYKKIKDLPEE